MRILGIETATQTGGIAIIEDDRVLVEYRLGPRATGDRAGERILVLLERALSDQGLTLDVLDAIAVSIGPGSYTGLRIGLGIVKGLVFGSSLPVVPVSTLAAIAAGVTCGDETVCPVLDAKKGQLYAARFRRPGGGRLLRLSPDTALEPAALVQALDGPTVFVGAGLERYGALFAERIGPAARFLEPAHWDPRPALVAELGRRALAAGESIAAGALQPAYPRASESEWNVNRTPA